MSMQQPRTRRIDRHVIDMNPAVPEDPVQPRRQMADPNPAAPAVKLPPLSHGAHARPVPREYASRPLRQTANPNPAAPAHGLPSLSYAAHIRPPVPIEDDEPLRHAADTNPATPEKKARPLFPLAMRLQRFAIKRIWLILILLCLLPILPFLQSNVTLVFLIRFASAVGKLDDFQALTNLWDFSYGMMGSLSITLLSLFFWWILRAVPLAIGLFSAVKKQRYWVITSWLTVDMLISLLCGILALVSSVQYFGPGYLDGYFDCLCFISACIATILLLCRLFPAYGKRLPLEDSISKSGQRMGAYYGALINWAIYPLLYPFTSGGTWLAMLYNAAFLWAMLYNTVLVFAAAILTLPQKAALEESSQGKSKTTAIILSVLLGALGIDRFYLGYIGLGIVKLITGGGLGIWWIIDLVMICTGALRPADGSAYREETERTQIHPQSSPSVAPAASSAQTLASHIKELHGLFVQGILSQEEYEKKKRQLLERM